MIGGQPPWSEMRPWECLWWWMRQLYCHGVCFSKNRALFLSRWKQSDLINLLPSSRLFFPEWNHIRTSGLVCAFGSLDTQQLAVARQILGEITLLHPCINSTCCYGHFLHESTEQLSGWKQMLTEPVHSKGDQSWVFIGRTDAKADTPILWPPYEKSWLIGKDSDAGKDWGQMLGEGDDRGWDGWMASLTWWTWVWVNSGSWWWTGRPGVLRFMGSQRVGHDWATQLMLSFALGKWLGKQCYVLAF